jgi:hypothetical protein
MQGVLAPYKTFSFFGFVSHSQQGAAHAPAQRVGEAGYARGHCPTLHHASHVTRLTSHVTRHASRLTRRTSHVTRHTSQVLAWLSAGAAERRDSKSNRDRLGGLTRKKQIVVLKQELGLSLECARGVATKLKQRALIRSAQDALQLA